MQEQAESLVIKGGTPLRGEVRINTAKNSALYLILASLLTHETVTLRDIPRLSDVLVALEILEHVGVEVRWEGRDLHLHAARIRSCGAPYSLVSKMRASFVAMGALLARCGRARISMPGGCAFGPRPVDRHITAFQALGAVIDEEGGDFHAFRSGPLAGRAVFEAPTVGGTQNVILATALEGGSVTIENAALEPEIADLANMLNAMGARITGAGTSTIRIEGVPELSGVDYRPVPDRIEAGTLMLATAATRGTVTLRGVAPAHLEAVSAKLRETGVRIVEVADDALLVDASGELKPADVTAAEYPEIPTDLQAPFSAYLATLPGASVVRDKVYPDRFTHVEELRRTGADVELFERTLIIRGGQLAGARLHAADIRAGGALVIAALSAKGTSTIGGLQFIDRGYEALTERLSQLGAQVSRRVVTAPSPTSGD
ncbi:MAG TPA: UDP-N-acetylglucosamine 1-carboxyvinyltransferase [Trueperaceae bacterium]